jgi:putative flippase GtrA
MLNYRYSFRSRRPHAEVSLKYLLVSLACLSPNAAVVALGTSVLDLHYLVVQVVATGIVLVVAFATNRAWTF